MNTGEILKQIVQNIYTKVIQSTDNQITKAQTNHFKALFRPLSTN